MAEDATNKRVLKALRGLHPVRVENPACAGTPDINYTGGWIENKHLPNWPRDPNAIVKVDHFTPQQRVWHKQRALAGGVSYVFVQIGREYLLMRGNDAADFLGRCSKQTLLTHALGYWPNGLVDSEFLAAIVTE